MRPRAFSQRFALIVFSLLSLFSQASAGADYPNRPIHLIVPYAAGGSSDVIARMVADEMSVSLKQTIVIDNRTGANGRIATDAVVKSPADGYTLLFGVASTIAMNPSLYRFDYDIQQALVPIGATTAGKFVLLVGPQVVASDLAALVKDARSHPGEMTYGSPGFGSHSHIAMELLQSRAQVKFTHAPYRGGGPALNDLLGGQIQLVIDTVGSALSYVQDGRLRAIATSGSERSTLLPNVPTIAETFPGYETTGWHGLFAPAGTPGPIIARLNDAMNAALQSPKLRDRVRELGFEILGGPPGRLADLVATDTQKFSELIARLDIRFAN
jgi:tripartite-type tricarboxylate transporter receptor subunit TctC